MTDRFDADKPTSEDAAAQTIAELWRDLAALAAYLRNVREDVTAIGVSSIPRSHIMPASDQLGAVVETAEAAATRILDACDTLMAVAREVGGEPARRIVSSLAAINEACGFHDLTGQRIVKVTQTLAQVERKITRLGEIFGVDTFATSALKAPGDVSPARPNDRTLLNGPQSLAQAIDQAAIDRLLAEID
jgi:chemotaxis protein CheZ